MAGDPRVLGLLEEMLDAGKTPDEVCRGCPELLAEVRERWREFRRKNWCQFIFPWSLLERPRGRCARRKPAAATVASTPAAAPYQGAVEQDVSDPRGRSRHAHKGSAGGLIPSNEK